MTERKHFITDCGKEIDIGDSRNPHIKESKVKKKILKRDGCYKKYG